mmetsp:Transcript_18173/g.43805  ORF Transcript_18173/g.43805 Transcript_18173/m.43805 type:complete len:146 (-) Transcript_18173:578-1015(-)
MFGAEEGALSMGSSIPTCLGLETPSAKLWRYAALKLLASAGPSPLLHHLSPSRAFSSSCKTAWAEALRSMQDLACPFSSGRVRSRDGTLPGSVASDCQRRCAGLRPGDDDEDDDDEDRRVSKSETWPRFWDSDACSDDSLELLPC